MTLARLIACLSAAVFAAPAQVRAQTPQGAPVIVVPFDNPSQDPRLGWMREGAAILLSEMLMSSGDVVIDREERLQAFDRLRLPSNAVLSRLAGKPADSSLKRRLVRNASPSPANIRVGSSPSLLKG